MRACPVRERKARAIETASPIQQQQVMELAHRRHVRAPVPNRHQCPASIHTRAESCSVSSTLGSAEPMFQKQKCIASTPDTVGVALCPPSDARVPSTRARHESSCRYPKPPAQGLQRFKGTNQLGYHMVVIAEHACLGLTHHSLRASRIFSSRCTASATCCPP